jgi:hypothetical protein
MSNNSSTSNSDSIFKFLLRVILFFIPIAILAYPLDLIISKSLATSRTFGYGEVPVWHDIYTGIIDSEIVIYGSSRAWVHIDPHKMQQALNVKAYNMGIAVHAFDIQYLRHLEYLKYNRRPDCILMVVDVNNLARQKEVFADEHLCLHKRYGPL